MEARVVVAVNILDTSGVHGAPTRVHLKPGDVVTVLSPSVKFDGFLQVRTVNGEEGLLPQNYLKMICSSPLKASSTRPSAKDGRTTILDEKAADTPEGITVAASIGHSKRKRSVKMDTDSSMVIEMDVEGFTDEGRGPSSESAASDAIGGLTMTMIEEDKSVTLMGSSMLSGHSATKSGVLTLDATPSSSHCLSMSMDKPKVIFEQSVTDKGSVRSQLSSTLTIKEPLLEPDPGQSDVMDDTRGITLMGPYQSEETKS